MGGRLVVVVGRTVVVVGRRVDVVRRIVEVVGRLVVVVCTLVVVVGRMVVVVGCLVVEVGGMAAGCVPGVILGKSDRFSDVNPAHFSLGVTVIPLLVFSAIPSQITSPGSRLF